MMRMIKVLVVDDSPVFRSLLTELISSDPSLEVVGSAEDPYQAREMIKRLNPDVITLDIEMPKMNGVQFLKNLMRLRPMPVVMISTLSQHGAEATLHALELGAVDYFPKPALCNTGDMLNYKDLINSKLIIAATANVAATTPLPYSSKAISHLGSTPLVTAANQRSGYDLIAIGASTGGTEAVRYLMSELPKGLPPILITQHISAMFTKPFAERLNSVSEVKVQELSCGTVPLVHGHAYVAPGDKHMIVVKKGTHLYAEIDDRPPVNRHKPSVDVMFDSIAEVAAKKSIGIILTGMGCDGAQGMLKMKHGGAVTIAQDEKSSVVWGMPRVAVEVGAAQSIKPLANIAQAITQYINRPASSPLV